MKALLIAFVMTALAGRALGAEATEFVPLRGAQPERALSHEPRVDRSYPVPIYYSWPDRPYEVIGYLHVYRDEWRVPLHSNAMRSAAMAAKARGADAVLLAQVPPATRDLATGPQRSLLVVAEAIKWQKADR